MSEENNLVFLSQDSGRSMPVCIIPKLVIYCVTWIIFDQRRLLDSYSFPQPVGIVHLSEGLSGFLDSIDAVLNRFRIYLGVVCRWKVVIASWCWDAGS